VHADEALQAAPVLVVEDHAQKTAVQNMIKLLKRILTNPGHDEYMCQRRKCSTCELQDTEHFETLREINGES